MTLSTILAAASVGVAHCGRVYRSATLTGDLAAFDAGLLALKTGEGFASFEGTLYRDGSMVFDWSEPAGVVIPTGVDEIPGYTLTKLDAERLTVTRIRDGATTICFQSDSDWLHDLDGDDDAERLDTLAEMLDIKIGAGEWVAS